MPKKTAASAALELYSAPSLVRQFRRKALPDDILILIKVAAGEPDAIATFPAHVSRDAEHVKEIAAFYIQQIMFLSDAGDYAVLGLAPDASAEKVREHKRWLLKWLHPDRNNNRWEQNYFLRVSEAADRLLKQVNATTSASSVPPVQTEVRRTGSSRRNEHSRKVRSREHAWDHVYKRPSLVAWTTKALLAVLVCFAAILLLRSLLTGGGDLFSPIFQDTNGPGLTGT
jgi:DnaJ domain